MSLNSSEAAWLRKVLFIIATYHDQCVAQAEKAGDRAGVKYHAAKAIWSRAIGENAEFRQGVETEELRELAGELSDQRNRSLESLESGGEELIATETKEQSEIAEFCRIMERRCQENM
tara:strand:- start:110704 stop:111057 length:354 start_codon:yes stop_codon:yes gene_type:complete